MIVNEAWCDVDQTPQQPTYIHELYHTLLYHKKPAYMRKTLWFLSGTSSRLVFLVSLTGVLVRYAFNQSECYQFQKYIANLFRSNAVLTV